MDVDAVAAVEVDAVAVVEVDAVAAVEVMTVVTENSSPTTTIRISTRTLITTRTSMLTSRKHNDLSVAVSDLVGAVIASGTSGMGAVEVSEVAVKDAEKDASTRGV